MLTTQEAEIGLSISHASFWLGPEQLPHRAADTDGRSRRSERRATTAEGRLEAGSGGGAESSPLVTEWDDQSQQQHQQHSSEQVQQKRQVQEMHA